MQKVVLILSVFSLFGCNSKPKTPLSVEKIRSGEQLHLATEITVPEFFQIWIRRDLPWKGNIQIMKVFEDNTYVYFFEHLFRNQSVYLGNRPFTKEPQLFKVKAAAIKEHFGAYEEIDGFQLRKLCAEHIAYRNETNSDRFPANLFEYKLKEEHIFFKIAVDDQKFRFTYSIPKKELIESITEYHSLK